MDVLRIPAPRRIAAGLLAFTLAAACVFARAPRPARAGDVLDVGDQVVVQLRVSGAGNMVELRTWDRPSVQIEGDGTPAVLRRTIAFGGTGQPLLRQVPPAFINPRDPAQPSLPPEEFPLAGLRSGPHDLIVITADPGVHLVVTVPLSTGVADVRVGGGRTLIDGFRGANLFAVQGGGQVHLQNVVTTAFLQLGGGALSAADSSFERVRIRTNAAHVFFEGVHSRQIEASSIRGAIVYDRGSFEPGLARFDSVSGTIALSVNGPAQVTGRSEDGRVVTMFERRDAAVTQGAGGTSVAVGGGGTLVNALSAHGNVLLYDGSLRTRHAVPEEFRVLHRALTGRPHAPPPPRARTSGAGRRPA